MKSLKFLRVLSIAFFFLFIHGNEIVLAGSEDADDYEKIRSGEKFLPHALLCGVYLDHFNLDNIYLRGAFLSFASFRGTSFVRANLEDCYLSGANFKGGNLREAKLDGSILSDANFENANVLKASLKDTIGLSNDQRIDLGKRGAINVPRCLSAEEIKRERELIEEWKKQISFSGQLKGIKNFWLRLFCCCCKKK